jgi:hypothetical protein
MKLASSPACDGSIELGMLVIANLTVPDGSTGSAAAASVVSAADPTEVVAAPDGAIVAPGAATVVSAADGAVGSVVSSSPPQLATTKVMTSGMTIR